MTDPIRETTIKPEEGGDWNDDPVGDTTIGHPVGTRPAWRPQP